MIGCVLSVIVTLIATGCALLLRPVGARPTAAVASSAGLTAVGLRNVIFHAFSTLRVIGRRDAVLAFFDTSTVRCLSVVT